MKSRVNDLRIHYKPLLGLENYYFPPADCLCSNEPLKIWTWTRIHFLTTLWTFFNCRRDFFFYCLLLPLILLKPHNIWLDLFCSPLYRCVFFFLIWKCQHYTVSFLFSWFNGLQSNKWESPKLEKKINVLFHFEELKRSHYQPVCRRWIWIHCIWAMTKMAPANLLMRCTAITASPFN